MLLLVERAEAQWLSARGAPDASDVLIPECRGHSTARSAVLAVHHAAVSLCHNPHMSRSHS
jgi:hypothetical protein